MMRIVWVSFTPLERIGAKVVSKVASVRYRLLIPASALDECDWAVIFAYESA